MSENVGFQGAAGVLMTVFVQCLAVLSVLRWSLTSLMSQQKGFWRQVVWDGGVLSLFPGEQRRPVFQQHLDKIKLGHTVRDRGPERVRGLHFFINGCRFATVSVGKA